MKKKIMVMMFSGDNVVTGMHKYDFDKKITLEILRSQESGGCSVLVRRVVFNNLKLDEILNYVSKTVNDLYDIESDFYAPSGSSKNYTLNILEALKERCVVSFSDELQRKWDYIINSIANAKVLYSTPFDYKSVSEARNKFNDIIEQELSFEKDVKRQMHEDGHPFRAIGMILDNVKKIDEPTPFKVHTVESFNKNLLNDKDIPEDLSSFRSICVGAGGIVGMTVVSGGKIVSNSKKSLESFINNILSERYRKDIFVVSAEDAVTLYRDFLKLYTGKDRYSEYNFIFTKFLGNILAVDSDELFVDSEDRCWDDKMLAQKILEKDDTDDTHDKCVMLVTDNEEFSIATDENGIPVGDTDQTKIMDYFGISKSDILIASCIILSKDETVLKFKSSFLECLDSLAGFEIDKLYVDNSIISSKYEDTKVKYGFVVNELKALFPKVEIVHKA